MVSKERRIEGISGIDVETERKPSIGVALVIVGIDPSRNGENITSPMLWTIVERKTNPATEKVAGQISFPGETSKIDEGLNQNLLGAVVEEFSGDDQKMNNLWYIRRKSHIEGKVLISRRPADLVVLAFTGSLETPNSPRATNEVNPNKWMTVEQLLKEHPDKVRKFTRQTAVLEQEEGLIRQVVNVFIQSPLSRIPLSAFLPKEFSLMDQFYQERKNKIDVAISSIQPKSY